MILLPNILGNWFVWIPVDYTASGADRNRNGLDDGFEAAFIAQNNNNNSETANGEAVNNNSGTADDEAVNDDNREMYKSVQKYHGFYVALRRALKNSEDGDVNLYQGVESVTLVNTSASNLAYVPYSAVLVNEGYYYLINHSALTEDCADPTNDSLEACYSYGFITTKGAISLANIYENSTSVVSTLCYSAQWRAMIKFIEEKNVNCIELGTYDEVSINNMPHGEWVLTSKGDDSPTILRYDSSTGSIITTVGYIYGGYEGFLPEERKFDTRFAYFRPALYLK